MVSLPLQCGTQWDALGHVFYDDKMWNGYAGGDAPGLSFATAEWLHEKEVAAICYDTWGCEVRPNETTDAQQP